MSVTLKDLAKACGVSVGTVSRALNETNEVSAKTSERIRQLAQELGYIPNRAGRALSAQKSICSLGIILPSINSPFFDDIKKGISAAARDFKDLGVEVILEEIEGWQVDKYLKVLDNLKTRNCRGYALCTVDDPRMVERLENFANEKIPVLLINSDLPEAKRICYVGPDYYRQGNIAGGMLQKCFQNQQLKILIIVGYRNHIGHKRRVDGFIDELKTGKADFEIINIIEGHDKDIDTQQRAMEAFDKNPEINCVFMASGSGVSGMGAAVIADSKHKRFVIACDEVYTTRELVKNNIIDFVICQEPYMQGYQAVRRLSEYINNKNSGPIDDYIVNSVIKIKNHFEDAG